MDMAERKELAQTVFESLEKEKVPAVALRLLASALYLADGPISRFATPLSCFADAVEFPQVTGELAEVLMASALRRAAIFPGSDELLDRLDGVQQAPWPTIKAALVAVRENEEK